MRSVVFMLLAFVALPGAVQEQKLKETELLTLGNMIVNYRMMINDTTRIDFCKADPFWSKEGSLQIGPTAMDYSKYSRRDACPTDSERSDNTAERSVVIHNVLIYADSVLVLGTTQTAARTILEEYRFGRNEHGLNNARYTIVAWVVD